jgi:uncharacterized small protein (DUF1192 family)
MDGIIYILNQTGMALAQAQAEIARLNAELTQLKNAPPQPPG